MAGGGLTPKQEAFCIAFIETGNASGAYRTAYKAAKMSTPAIHVAASRLLDNPTVALRVAELKAALVERHNVTADSIRDMLIEDREFARKCETPAAAVSATMGLAKLYGLLTEKIDAKLAGEIGMREIVIGRASDAG